MSRPTLLVSPSAAVRVERARAWLGRRDASDPLVVLGGTQAGADALVRDLAGRRALLGWTRLTLYRLASQLALAPLAASGRAPAGALTREAVVARVVFELAEHNGLGRYAELAEQPGLARALAQTFEELRMAGVTPDAPYLWSADLLRIYRAYLAALDSMALADTAELIRTATARVAGGEPHPLLDIPLLLLDVRATTAIERDFIAALLARAPSAWLGLPHGDGRSVAAMSGLPGVRRQDQLPAGDTGLSRVQARLFDESASAEHAPDATVEVLSAPGESRECVEIVRRIVAAAREGVPFDEMAVLVRSPGQYRPHLVEAFRRAGVPAWFAGGTLQPDPSGRSMLALLACAAEGLSASRMAEFLSLGEAARPDDSGAPPPATGDAGLPPPDDELTATLRPPEEEVGSEPDAATTVLAPRLWEQLLVDAAVIGGRDRWERRLDGLEERLRLSAASREEEGLDASRLEGRLEQVSALRAYVLPLVDQLAALPTRATWAEWLEALAHVAQRALRQPERVLRVLAELAPMGSVGPVGLSEVRIVLGRRLGDLMILPTGRLAGRVFVAPVEEARAMSFRRVFVPGLAERLFPKKVVEDPILLDSSRGPMAVGLTEGDDRVADERLALHLAVGAASESLVISFPRIDLESARPRVPSFYGLEVLRAAEGRLPGFEELMRRAEASDAAAAGARRIGWPAPADPAGAIDRAEYDLAWLGRLMESPAGGRVGSARYLMSGNPHLSRALRHRYMVGQRVWTRADGLVSPRDAAVSALSEHGLDARSFSPTALQQYAACPYKFFLYTIMRLQPREVPEAIEELSALDRGSLVHDAQYDLLVELERDGLLPLDDTNRHEARARLDAVLDRLAAEYRDNLAPAIDRVWEDGITLIRSDLHEWLFRLAYDSEWTPYRFELAFGPFRGDRRDERSRPEPVQLDCGISVHGSIDRVDRARVGIADKRRLRATDTKTGKVAIGKDAVVAGGKALQPVIYALALEQMMADDAAEAGGGEGGVVEGGVVEGGRLDYCTSRGGFDVRDVALDDRARRAATRFVEILGEAFEHHFFPRAPAERECRWCDFQAVCGENIERRLEHKAPQVLFGLTELRRME